MSFKVGDVIHAKPQYPWLKQDVLYIKGLDSDNYYILKNIITNKTMHLTLKDTECFFEKTYCHVPARHPLTSIFQ